MRRAGPCGTLAGMSRVLHDLALLDDRRPSPFCWRIKFALAHKGLEFTTHPVAFTEIPQLLGGGHKTVPILEDDGVVVGDSWAIVDHLDARYPDVPLFRTPQERALARFVEAWSFLNVGRHLVPMLVLDIHDHARPEDRAYFRQSREARLGKTLEEAAAGYEQDLAAMRAGLDPARLTFTYLKQPFLSGDAPGYADYILASVLLWAASIAPRPLLAPDDPVVAWFDRVRDLHDGLGRRGTLYPITG